MCFKSDYEGTIALHLESSEDLLSLKLDVNIDQFADRQWDELPPFIQSIKERSVLSGGAFAVQSSDNEKIRVQSDWLLGHH